MASDGGRGRPRTAALLLGIGLGGFVDGIALHQIAQWHNMLSVRIPPVSMEAMRTNMTADGWFHAAVWLCTMAGVWQLYAAARGGDPIPPPRWFAGMLLLGWGAFNTVEGVIDHHLLELHHVRDVPVHLPMWDWGFLLVGGLGFLAVGALMARRR